MPALIAGIHVLKRCRDVDGRESPAITRAKPVKLRRSQLPPHFAEQHAAFGLFRGLRLDKLHQDGQTIIMVTHEPDVARHAKRIIRMKDGKVLSDLPVEKDPVAA